MVDFVGSVLSFRISAPDTDRGLVEALSMNGSGVNIHWEILKI